MARIMFEGITPEEFASLLTEKLLETRSLQPPPASTKPGEDLLTRTETAGYLKVTLSTLFRWEKSGKLHAHHLGGRVYYKRQSIELALKNLNKSNLRELP